MSLFDPTTTTIAILLIGGIVLIAFGSDALAQRFRIPDVLWLILFGLLAGPVFHIVSPAQVTALGAILGTIALVLILYDAGIDFNPREARTVGVSAVLLAVISFGLSAIVLFAVAMVFLTGYNLTLSLLFALALAGISGAVTLPIAHRLGYSGPTRDTLNLDLAIEDTLGVLAVTILLALIASPEHGWSAVVPQVLLPLPLAIVFGVAGGFIAIEFLSRWQSRVYAGLAVMGLLFVVYGGTEALDGSGIMASLIMGVVLGNDAFFRRWLPRSSAAPFAFDPMVRQVHNDIAFVLRAVFLVILGILVPFQPAGIIASIAVIALPLLLWYLRRLSLERVGARAHLPSDEAKRLGSLYGRGLTNAVLLILALAVLPQVQSILFPAFIVIIGTDIVMTVLIFLEEPGSEGGPATPNQFEGSEYAPAPSESASHAPAQAPAAPPPVSTGSHRGNVALHQEAEQHADVRGRLGQVREVPDAG